MAAPRSPRVGVRAAIVREGQILLNEYTDGVFDLPGGGQEHGETQHDAVMREVLEETGLTVRVHTLAFVFEAIANRAARTGRPIDTFHQVNLVFWAEVDPRTEAVEPTGMDGSQVGTRWVPIDHLDRYDVRPAEVAAWLMSDPSTRLPGLGTIRA